MKYTVKTKQKRVPRLEGKLIKRPNTKKKQTGDPRVRGYVQERGEGNFFRAIECYHLPYSSGGDGSSVLEVNP